MNIVEYFDQTRIINIATRKDRRKETEREFSKYGLPINNGKVEFFDGIRPSDASGFPNHGVKGCFLSHMGVIQHARDANLDHILVMEDDVTFSKHILDYGKLATSALHDLDWDILYLGHSLEDQTTDMGWKKVHEPIYMAHCYAINRNVISDFVEFLQLLLSRPEGHPDGGPMHYDGAIFTFIQNNPAVNAYYYSYNLAYQRPSRTDLHDLGAYDKNKYLRPVMQLFRNIKRIYFRLSR